MNILFTCAGRRTYLLKYFKENLSEGDRVLATDMQLSAPALQVADVKIQVPAVYDPDYVDITLGICKDYKVDALISLNDLELPILAKNKGRFEAVGTKVIVSDPEIIDIAFDKYETAKWVESIGLHSPNSYVRLEDCKKALAAGEIQFPLFMKPRWGSGSIGLETIYDMEELDIYYKLLKKKIKRTFLAKASVGDEYIMIQEKLTGEEFGLDVMNDLEGNFVGVSVKKKLAMRSGETDKAITLDDPELREIGKKIGENLKHIGNLDVDIMVREVKGDRLKLKDERLELKDERLKLKDERLETKKEYCVLELNPRFGGGFPFSYEAGVNLPQAIIQWLQGNLIDPSILQPTPNLTFAKNDYLMSIL